MSATPRAGVSLHLLDDAAVLFDAPAQRLFRLNPAASALWCLMEEGLGAAEMTVAMSQRLGTSRATAAGWTSAALEQWRRHGLLAGAAAPAPIRRAGNPARAAPVEPPARVRARIPRRRYRTRGGALGVAYGSHELERRIHPVLAHLEAAQAAPLRNTAEVVAGPGGYHLQSAGTQLGACRTLAEAAPLVHGYLPALSMLGAGTLLTVHAAALARTGACLLLPAPAGHGKTTLATALMAAGWRYLSDDLVPLDHRTLHAIPMPLSLAIKEGAWPLAASYFPDLLRCAVHARADGQRVRYLRPVDWTLEPVPIRWIVFPRYQRGAASRLQPLAPADALSRLLACCSALPGTLDASDMERLVRWIAARPSLVMQVGDPDRAVQQLEALASQGPESCTPPTLATGGEPG